MVTLAGQLYGAGFADGTGSAANFFYPYGVAMDATATAAFVCDKSNNRVRRVSIATGAVTSIAGDGTRGCVDGVGTAAQFSSPVGIAVNAAGSFAVVVSLIDGGLATRWNNPLSLPSSSFSSPQVDSASFLVRSIEIQAGRVATLSGQCNSPGFADGARALSMFALPSGVAFIFGESAVVVVRTEIVLLFTVRVCLRF